MSWVSDFNKLHVSTKSTILSIAALMPFWFISIYLFNKPLYHQKDLYVLISFCFCFSIVWYAANIVLTVLFISLVEEKKEDTSAYYAFAGVLSLSYLSLAIAISYYAQWSFNTFLWIAFSYILLNIILFLILLIINSRERKNKSTKEIKLNN